MLSENVRDFVARSHHGVLATFRRDGAVQMSIVSCGPFRDGVAFTTTAGRAKLANLKRDSRCSLMVSEDNWWGYIVLEGGARLISPEDTDPEELRHALRDVYRAAGGGEHPDRDEFDRAMVEDRRSVVSVVPDRVYGTAL